MADSSTEFRLENQYQQLLQLIRGLDDGFISKQHRPEKWSIKENLAHLGRYQEIFLERIDRILVEDQPAFGRYKADNDPEFAKWRMLETSLITDKTIQGRAEIVAKLEGLSLDSLERQGHHPKLGLMTIFGWIEFFLLHESHHIYTVFWLVNEFRNT
ncbi:DinB family protein [Fulvivirgaceae bacterium BMA12]|uniref:DinB family protein n=1 Tax=Agaribacillus aureus TaxID=3051825 RepID=A0ABT8L480_9BACT|nr:DinB family protein [Fulvivirgaceae bacterium BMA12]